MRIMRSLYRIDDFQETYFVIDSFDQLFEATRPDFTPHYGELAELEDIPANGTVPGGPADPAGLTGGPRRLPARAGAKG